MEKTKQLGALYSVFFTTYHSGDQIKKNEMSEACSTCGGRRSTCRVLVERPEGRRPLVRRMYEGDDNIKIDL